MSVQSTPARRAAPQLGLVALGVLVPGLVAEVAAARRAPCRRPRGPAGPRPGASRPIAHLLARVGGVDVGQPHARPRTGRAARRRRARRSSRARAGDEVERVEPGAAVEREQQLVRRSSAGPPDVAGHDLARPRRRPARPPTARRWPARRPSPRTRRRRPRRARRSVADAVDGDGVAGDPRLVAAADRRVGAGHDGRRRPGRAELAGRPGRGGRALAPSTLGSANAAGVELGLRRRGERARARRRRAPRRRARAATRRMRGRSAIAACSRPPPDGRQGDDGQRPAGAEPEADGQPELRVAERDADARPAPTRRTLRMNVVKPSPSSTP